VDFDTNALLLSLLIGAVGLALFVYGKKQQRLPHLIAGVLLMVYPYFVDTAIMTLVVGVVIGAALWFAVRMGY